MTREEFEAWVRQLEEFSREKPRRYRMRVAALAILGCAFVFGLPLFVLLGAGLLVVLVAVYDMQNPAVFFGIVALLIPLLGTAFIICRSLVIRIPPPQGVILDRDRAAALYEAVEALRQKLRAPHVHVILMNHSFNAAAAQRPRLGIFGWYRNYLILGLPLMAALSPRQFSAVVAHELAHLSGMHNRFNAWIYRLSRTWEQMLPALAMQQKVGTRLTFRFFRWYVPLLHAYAFILCRQHEYEADRAAAEIAGADDAAAALMSVNIAGGYLRDHFWPGVQKLAENSANPPPGLLALMARTLPKAASAPDAPKWLRQSLLVETDFADTHPCLADRIGALGHLAKAESAMEAAWKTAGPPPLKRSAAQEYFGAAFEPLTGLLEKDFQADIAPEWQAQHMGTRKCWARLLSLEKKARYGHLSTEEALEQCVLVSRLRGGQAAVPLARDLLLQYPEAPNLHLLLGRVLLEQKDPSGIGHIEKAMDGDLNAVYPGCELIYTYYKEAGRPELGLPYLRRAEKHYAALRVAERERDGFNASDAFEHHGLTGDLVYYLVERIEEIEDVQEAYLVRKSLSQFVDRPMYVLALQPKKIPWYDRWHREGVFGPLVNKVRTFPHSLHVLRLDRVPKRMAASIRAVPNSRIYPIPGRRRRR